MNRFASPYYPPRARWYSALFGLWHAVKRRTWLDRIELPAGISPSAFVASLLVPGLAFYVRGEKLIAKAIFIGELVLAAIFVIWLGYPFANFAFGLLLSAHVSSIIFLLNPWVVGARLRFRIGLSLALLALISGFLYNPLRNYFQTHCLMPIRLNGEVIVIQQLSSAKSVKRGDWIAYSLDANGVQGVRVQEGYGLRPVLAVAGDHIRFATNAFQVNGIAQPLLPYMPTSGEIIVAEKQWFVWPQLAISGHGNGEQAIAGTMLQLARISESAYIGKPFKRWFLRRQHLI